MRQRQLAGLATATVIALGIGLPLPATASAADGNTLYVNNAPSANCSDSGTGAQAAPFCTIQAAADHAQAGQTVQVAAAKYREQVTLTHSGAPGKPITFVGGQLRNGMGALPVVGVAAGGQPALDHGFVLNGVHDIRISGFAMGGQAESVLLTDTGQVNVDGNLLYGGQLANLRQATIRLTGTTTATTVSRNIVNGYAWNGIVVDPGVTGTVLTTNAVDNMAGAGGIQVTDAPGTVITSNSVSSTCGPAVALLGNSSNAVVKNNVLATSWDDAHRSGVCQAGQSMAKLTVSASSVADTSADYNLANPYSGAPVYDWAGTSYTDATAFAKAVPQQGAHDITGDPQYSGAGDTMSQLHMGPGSPGIDSADASAPGELPTDLYGYQRIDDPYVTNSGTGPGYYDRGAFEYTTSSRWVGLSAGPNRVPTGSPTTLTVNDQESWSPVVSYTYDFGDGSPTVTTTATSVQHSYQTAGTYTPSAVVTMQNGDTITTRAGGVIVSPPAPLVPKLSISPLNNPLEYSVSASDSTSPWSLTKFTYDFGDGSAPDTEIYSATGHAYTREGDYTVTVAVTDAGGRTEKTTQQLHVAYRPTTYHAMTPTRVLDTREHTPATATLAPGGTLTVPLLTRMGAGLGTLPFDQSPTAVVLNVTAVSKDWGGFLSVYPAGTDKPGTSNVNFAAKQTVPNLITVPVGPTGDVQISNSYGGNVDVVVDILGYYSSVTQVGDKFTPLAPSRLVDTRTGNGGPLGGDTTRNVMVRGVNGVPTAATAVVLNLTGTEATDDTYLTVYPGQGTRPTSSDLNPTPGRDVANQVIVPIGPDGTINVYNHVGSTQVVMDVFGYYSPNGQSLFTPKTPTRLLDTRTTPNAKPGPDSTTMLTGIPAGATGAVLNVTATGSTDSSYLTVYPHGTARPGTSNLNTQPGQDVPNHVTTPVSPDGQADIYNHVGSTDIVADLFGYFTNT